jgi:FMN hydrolase / 5-amino-6-(5-phospho-D-ribitylamino)uracil phosphatase
MLRAVCFDLMDTVLFDPYREAVRAATGMDLDEVHPLRDPAAWRDFEMAIIDEPEFARRFFADGTMFDIATFHRVRRAGYRWLPGMRALVEDLEGTTARFVASNYPFWIEELRARFRLDDHFDGIWASHHLGVRKPEPVFYARLADRIGVEPSECLFVDDREANCEGAKLAGFRVHVFESAEDLRARLAAEGLFARR